MNLIFSNKVLAPFLILIGVPLILHLFARSRPPAYQFSSIEFILRIVRSTIRLRRPRDWILLSIRTLLFATVVFLFLRPVFFSNRQLAGPFEKKNVVLVIDATASMAYTDAGQTRFAAACAEASDILSGLSSMDTANIVWLDSAPDAVFPGMGVNISYLQSVLRQARVTNEAGDIAEAMRLAANMVQEMEGKHEIYVVSDFQRTAWEGEKRILPAKLELVNVKIGTAGAMNKAITDIQCNPHKPLAGEEVTVFCEVHNYADQPQHVAVFLGVEESRQSQKLMIPAWKEATAVFKHTFTNPGVFPIAVSLGEDSFTGDDRRWAAVEVREFLRAGILAREQSTAGTWGRALDAVGWVRSEMLTDHDLAGSLPFDVVMLSGWDGSFSPNLRKRLEEGCTIVCFPAPGVSLASVADLAGGDDAPRDAGLMRWEQLGDAGCGVTVVNEKDDVFRLFADSEYGDPSRGVFRARLNFPRHAVPGGEVLMAYDDGVPALVKFKKKGSMLLWNLSLDSKFSNWAGQMEFLPFLAELLLTSRASAGGERESMDFLPGQLVGWRLDRDVLASAITLNDDNGNSMAIREHRDGRGVSFVSQTPPEPGLYAWRHEKELLGYSVLNFPSIESDLRMMSLSDVEQSTSVTVGEGGRARQLRDGVSLWVRLLALAVVLALIEGITLVWAERT